MRKYISLIIFLNSIFFTLSCQTAEQKEELISDKSLSLIGYQDQEPLFIDDQNTIYKLKVDKNSRLSISKIKDPIDLKEKWLLYINDDLEIYASDQAITLYKGKTKHKVMIDKKHIGGVFRPSFCISNNLLICALNGMNDLNEEFMGDNLRYVDLNNIGDSAISLPFLASNVQSTNGWIFYSESILNDDGTITYSNIYKVKPGKWDQRELVIEKNSTEGWAVLPNNSNMLYAKVSYNKKRRYIVLDVDKKKFAELSESGGKIISSLKELLILEKQQKVYFIKKNSNAEEQVSTYLVPFPDIPREFPYNFK